MRKMKKMAILFAMVAVMLMAMAVVSFATATPSIADVDITISGTTVSVTGAVTNPVTDQEVTVLLVSDDAWTSSDITDGVIKYIDQIPVTNGAFSYNFTLDQNIINAAADYTLIHGGTSVEVAGQSVLPLAEASGYKVSGIVSSYVNSADLSALTSVKVALKTSVKGSYVSEIVTASATGTFEITGVQNGSYVLEIKREGYLTRYVAVVVDGGDKVVDNKTLYAGDCNSDTTVGPADYSILSAAFNAVLNDASGKYKVQCDFNLDKTIGPADYSLLSANFNKTISSYNEAGVDLTQ